MVFRCVIFLVLLHFVVASGDWEHCAVLDGDGKYHVCWKVLEQDIKFLVEVKARGYVGFGLSPSGGMTGSDIVTGWVKNGHAFFQDRHGVGNTLPPLDRQTDWFLIAGSENETHTSLLFRRKLDTCDNDDVPIDDSTIRLIYAYSEDDPVSEKELQYHFQYRGSKSVFLLQQNQDKKKKNIDESTLSYWDVLSPNFTLTREDPTKYMCKIYKGPDVVGKNHIVMAKPFLQPGNEGYVHHMLLYECNGRDAEEYDAFIHSPGHVCRHPNMPDAMKSCEGVFLVWAVGGDDVVLPPNAGLPLIANESKYYMMELHYDNSQRHDGIVDQSGFRIYYTPQLREYDAGSLMIGATVTPRMFIPPLQEEYLVAYHSSHECMDRVMPPSGINIIAVLLHSHLLGRALKLRHFRNGTELKPLGTDDNYDFNYQEYRYFPEPVNFLPGDQMTMECIYDSSGRNATTFGGESTEEEMCLAFLLYYPRIELFASVSVPTLEEISTATGLRLTSEDPNWLFALKDNLTNFDWTSINVKNLQNDLQFSMQNVHCYEGNGTKNKIKHYASYPVKFQEYQRGTICTHQEFVRSASAIPQGNFSFMLILFVLYFAVKCNRK